ncbi:MAG: EamA family transporter RarD [candidate division WOR-3 bacterium]|nr:MAG: EamA family transporter RarD [candidate division WOR-3 bacterium]
MQDVTRQNTRRRQGIIYTAVAFFAWGVLPFYWKAVGQVPALEILAHRILWSFAFITVVLAIQKKVAVRRLLHDRSKRRALLITSCLIGLNWFMYVYAVNSERIVEASMGYYINPILSVFLGIIILKERLNLLQVVAFLFACAGVFYLTLDYGRFPWISVVLACAFALYGLFKKTTDVESLSGLMIETMFLSPVAAFIIIYQALVGRGALLNASVGSDLLLIGAGVVTTMPLYWFAQGTKRIRLSSVGFLQYIAPSLMLLIGVFVYHEVFTSAHLISFGLVWCGLALYTISLMRGAGA